MHNKVWRQALEIQIASSLPPVLELGARCGVVPVGLSFLSSYCRCDDPCRTKKVVWARVLGRQQHGRLRDCCPYVTVWLHPGQRVLHLHLCFQSEVVAQQGRTVAFRPDR